MFKKIDGYYWVKQDSGTKIGYPTLHSLFADESYYIYIMIGLLVLNALAGVVAFVAVMMK